MNKRSKRSAYSHSTNNMSCGVALKGLSGALRASLQAQLKQLDTIDAMIEAMSENHEHRLNNHNPILPRRNCDLCQLVREHRAEQGFHDEID